MDLLLKLLKDPDMRAAAVTGILAIMRAIVNSPDAEKRINDLIDLFAPKK